MHDVFLSYSRKDKDWVREFAATLEGLWKRLPGDNPRIFLDIDDINTGDEWERRILGALENCTLLVPIFTRSYFESKWCKYEWDHFITREQDARLIFPIKLEKVDHSDVDRSTRGWIDDANKRQYKSFVGVDPDDSRFSPFRQKTTEMAMELLSMLASIFGQRPKTRSGTNRKQFVELLSQAKQVTIVGFTHENLVEYLEEALNRKRRDCGDPEAFWTEIRIVFISESLLPNVHDEFRERGLAMGKDDAALDRDDSERSQTAGAAKRYLSRFLARQDQPRRWGVYEYDYMLPFLGARFEMQDGQRIFQVATLRPGHPTSEHLFLDFAGRCDAIGYYDRAFQKVVERSHQHSEIILTGRPRDQEFICDNTCFHAWRRMPGVNMDEWVAAIVILLWRREDGQVHPLLQMRTPSNSTRELDMLSNLSGYVNLQDTGGLQGRSSFQLLNDHYEAAMVRELGEELEVPNVEVQDVELVSASPYYSVGRENLYFRILSVRLETPLGDVAERAMLHDRSLEDMLQVRDYQVLTKTRELSKSLDESEDERQTGLQVAATVLANNLRLHDRPELAEQLLEAIENPKVRPSFANEIRGHVEERERKMVYDYDEKGETSQRPILGLAGLQYREFFSTLLPCYEKLGVTGAKEYRDQINKDPRKSESLSALQQHYQNPIAIRKAMIDV